MTHTNSDPLPLRAPAKQRSRGCWLVAFTAIVLFMILLPIGLMLPPFNLPDRLLALQYDRLNTNNPEFSFDDSFSVNLLDRAGSDDFALRIAVVSLADITSGSPTIPESLSAAIAELPDYLALQSPLYALTSLGTAPDNLQFVLDLPSGTISKAHLSLFGWDGNTWRFVPSRLSDSKVIGESDFLPIGIAIFETIHVPPLVMVSQELSHDLNDGVKALATIISPAGLRPTRTGGLSGSLAPGGDTESSYLYMPLIRNFDDPRVTDPATISQILGNEVLRAHHILLITDLASVNGFHGVFIDYRDLPLELRLEFNDFIHQLRMHLHKNGLRLGIVVQAGYPLAVENDAYDWRTLAAAVDYFKLDVSVHPLDFSDDVGGSVAKSLRRAIAEVDRYKLLLGLSALSVREADGSVTRIGIEQALSALGDVQISADKVSETGAIEPGTTFRVSLNGLDAIVDTETLTNMRYVEYLGSDGSPVSRVWLVDVPVLQERMELAATFALAGIAFDDLLATDLMPGIVQAVQSFKLQSPVFEEAPAELSARWTIDGNDGPLGELITRLDEDLVLTLIAPEGNYAINMSVIDRGGKSRSQRSGAALPLFNPTATPTPTPTPTPVPTPTPRPAPVYVAPVSNNQPPSGSSGNFAAVPPPAGSISIEIGGHVTAAGSGRAIGAMHAAGMTWMKIQARFDWSSPPDMAREINIAHNNGFKILVGTVGRPNELDQGRQAYIDSFTEWLARMAGQGADAIEVWNEPNLDREWPRGQISGAAYASMLSTAYQKIKSANPNTLVISAAPAPTGVSDRPDQVMPDNQWLREMVAAGALNHLDCVGAHYNEGIIPPSHNSGDPRGDNYYTRYFYGMLNGYISITRRPICFTELGYLTAEGFPALSDYFAWADNVTVAQQAAWLAEAAALASRSGQVRLLIVWNVDLTHYGADPQAGYAIIRPDGSCPACTTLAQAR